MSLSWGVCEMVRWGKPIGRWMLGAKKENTSYHQHVGAGSPSKVMDSIAYCTGCQREMLFPTPRGHLTVSGDTFGCPNWGMLLVSSG